jgi:cell division protein FtsI (penicillin-binding protein 3)
MATRDDTKLVHRNYFIVAFVFAAIILGIVARASYTIFVDASNIPKPTQPTENPVTPARGNIYSANLELMATSETRYRFYMDFWADGLKGDTLKKYVSALAAELSRLLPDKSASRYESDILTGWNRRVAEQKQIEAAKARGDKNPKVAKTRDYRLAIREVNYSEYKQILKMPFFKLGTNKTGLKTRKHIVRTKPYGLLASRTIGDIYGDYETWGALNGLEMQFDSLLRGTSGLSIRQRVEGRTVNVITKSPVAGYDVVSTIDVTMQDIVEKALYDKVSTLDAESGTAVLMEVKTGEIKAIANLGRRSEGVWDEKMNYAVSDLSEPGSTFKVASMMVALEDGVVKPDDPVDVGNGVFPYAGHKITDHNANRGGYGAITAEKTIWYSSNVGVSKIILRGYENNPGKYVDGLYRLGFNQDLELEIPGYGVAKVKHPDSSKQWSKLSLPQMSYGYETQIPPIYTLTFFNAIANDGQMVKPRFVSSIMANGQLKEEKKPVVLKKQICSDQTLRYIRSMLDSVVNYPAHPSPNIHNGTGKPAKSNIVRIAGKTGTAQIWSGGSHNGYQVSFCGFFPSDKPKYSCIVVIRRPRNGAPSGGNMCGTVFKRIAEEVYAENMLAKPAAMPDEMKTTKIPPVKNGLFSHLKYAMNKLDVDCEGAPEGEWAKMQPTGQAVAAADLKVSEKIVPDVVGMGAKDAIFALETAGLSVKIAGRGKVISQSINAGTASAGQSILLQLK